jgi:predicted HTH transcriptional regulator
MSHEGLEQRLDLLIALTRIGIRDQLASAERTIRDDAVLSSILRHLSAQDSVGAGPLKSAVRQETGQSDATIRRRIAELVKDGAVLREGAGPGVKYSSSGLFEI